VVEKQLIGLTRVKLSDDTFTSVLFPKYDSTTPDDTTTSDSDLLPLLSKLAIVLQAEEDIVAVQKALREIDVLEKGDVGGAGQLAGKEEIIQRMRSLVC
jgi:hypothetical protein